MKLIFNHEEEEGVEEEEGEQIQIEEQEVSKGDGSRRRSTRLNLKKRINYAD